MLNVLFAMLTLINHILVIKVILTFIKQIVHVNFFVINNITVWEVTF